MPDTLLIPGLNGSPADHWQRHWARERRNASVVEQDDWTCPILSDWRERLDARLASSPGAFLVAHSLGCLLVASYARRLQSRKIAGAMLVAPCSLDVAMDMHPCMINFGSAPLDSLPFPSLVVGSLDDPYMGVERLEYHARCWGSDLTTIGMAGHINVASGFGRWPAGYDFLDRLKRQAGNNRRVAPKPVRSSGGAFPAN